MDAAQQQPNIFIQHGGETQPYASYLANDPSKITIITDFFSVSALATLTSTIDWTLCNSLIVFKDKAKGPIDGNMHPHIFLFEYDDGTSINILINELIDNNMITTPYYYIAYNNTIPTSVWLTLRLSSGADQACEQTADCIWRTDGEFRIGRQLCPIQMSFMQYIKSQIKHLTIDTTAAYTELCSLATRWQTDKSVYNFYTHRHPYTSIYNMFLGTLCALGRPLVIGEIGVLNGSSIYMFLDYFGAKNTYHAFDIDEAMLAKVADIPQVTTHCLDSGNITQLNAVFSELPQFDLLLEDASHRLEHQVTAIRECMKYIRVGGLMIVEDIFREINIERFQEAINAVVSSGICVDAYMITPENSLRYSKGWDNDRMLIIRRLS